MKPLPLLLALSVAANFGLGVAVYRRMVPPGRAQPVPAAAATPTAAAPANWDSRSLAAEADAGYLEQLRRAGFSSNYIRALVIARLQQRYADRFRSVRKPRQNVYWRGNMESGSDPLSPEERAAVRAISNEMMEEARKLLGGDALLEPYEIAMRERSMGHLSPEKMRQVDAINKDYGELTSQFNERTKGLVLKADREQLRLLEREKRADLAAVLTPEELEEYDLRGSSSANGVRNRLTYFEPTEEEFRAIAKLQLELDQTYGTSNLSAEEQERRRAAEKEMPAKIQAVLTPERFAEYQVTTDGSFYTTQYFFQSIGLDIDAAKQVVGLQRSMTQRADAIRSQVDLDPAQRAAALAALEQEATGQLTAKLGEKNFALYQRGAGSWLAKLRPPPPKK